MQKLIKSESFKNSLLLDPAILGSALLIAGCCIGAGMLALPITTGLVGFFPSLVIFLFVWWYMLATAKLLLEANSWYKDKTINLITLCNEVLGPIGKWTCWVTFIFLFYCLLTAYFAKGGEMFGSLISLYWASAPKITGPLFLVAFTAYVVYAGVKHVDRYNCFFMFFMVLSFLILINLSSKHVMLSRLNYFAWSGVFFLIPFLITSFGFHNIIPSLKNYLKNDFFKLRCAITLGSTIPLVVYLSWLVCILSVIPLEGENGIIHNFLAGKIATEALGVITGSNRIATVSFIFAITAIVTSVLGQSISVVDFLIDGLNLKARSKRITAVMLAVTPPFVFSQIYPNIFFKALEFAGGFAAIILYGILPVLIVWRGRYVLHRNTEHKTFCHKYTLSFLFFVAVGILLLQTMNTFGFLSVIPEHVNIK